MEAKRIPSHPGEIIKEEIESRGITQKQLASMINVPYTQLNEILNCKRVVSVDFALLIEAALGINPELLINMQNRHNMAVARQRPSLVQKINKIRQLRAAMF